MASRFEGLNHLEWKLFSNLFPLPQKRTVAGLEQPHVELSILCCTSCWQVVVGVISQKVHHGLPRVQLIGGSSVGTRMGRWNNSSPGFWGWPRIEDWLDGIVAPSTLLFPLVKVAEL